MRVWSENGWRVKGWWWVGGADESQMRGWSERRVGDYEYTVVLCTLVCVVSGHGVYARGRAALHDPQLCHFNSCNHALGSCAYSSPGVDQAPLMHLRPPGSHAAPALFCASYFGGAHRPPPTADRQPLLAAATLWPRRQDGDLASDDHRITKSRP